MLIDWQNPNVVANNVDATQFRPAFGRRAQRPSPRESASPQKNSIRLDGSSAGRRKIRLVQTCGIPALL